MHKMVIVNKYYNMFWLSILCCKGRIIEYDKKVLNYFGKDFCFSHLLNSSCNFIATKLAGLIRMNWFSLLISFKIEYKLNFKNSIIKL